MKDYDLERYTDRIALHHWNLVVADEEYIVQPTWPK